MPSYLRRRFVAPDRRPPLVHRACLCSTARHSRSRFCKTRSQRHAEAAPRSSRSNSRRNPSGRGCCSSCARCCCLSLRCCSSSRCCCCCCSRPNSDRTRRVWELPLHSNARELHSHSYHYIDRRLDQRSRLHQFHKRCNISSLIGGDASTDAAHRTHSLWVATNASPEVVQDRDLQRCTPARVPLWRTTSLVALSRFGRCSKSFLSNGNK